jgi:hypothetical protein
VKTQKAIRIGAGLKIQDPEFSRRLDDKYRQEFDLSEVAGLWRYAHAELPEVVAWVAANPTRTHDGFRHHIKAIEELYLSLARFYATHPEQLVEYHQLRLEGFYHSFKYSYRWHERILRAVTAILTVTSDRTRVTILVERQVSPSGTQQEDTVGAIFSKTGTLWAEAQETQTGQPRKFVFPIRDIHHTTTGTEYIQSLCGFVVETYAKYPNHYRQRYGSFSSPVALQRITDPPFEQALKSPSVALDELDAALTNLTRDCGYLSRTAFLRDATISPLVRDHMKYHDWSDSNRDRRKARRSKKE